MLIITPCTAQPNPIHHYLYISGADLPKARPLLERPDIEGVQIVYDWKTLEPSRDKYDFTEIEQALSYLAQLKKKLFIQIQDRFFTPEDRNVPSYILNETVYHGGLAPQFDNPGENKPQGQGWVARQWDPSVRKRYQRLLKALATAFDGRIYGINLPETSVDIDMKHDSSGFNCDTYFNAELENIKFARKVFKRSYVVQYVNFFPCEWNNDHQYMSRLFLLAEKNNIGLGGPDIIPGQKSQLHNSYPFFNQYKGRLPLVAMAIQEPTLTYINPKTAQPFTRNEFIEYAEDYLGANIIFWTLSAPWLQSTPQSPG